MNLLQFLKSLFSKTEVQPIIRSVTVPAPPPAPGPLSVADILTSSGQYPDRMTSPECTDQVKYNAAELISRVNTLLRELNVASVKVNSGFRTSEANKAAGGATASCHLSGMAVDLSDPDNSLEGMITDELLAKYDLYREAPGSTRGWVHLDTKARATRTFQIKLRVVKS